jgi:hypothetical protein
VNQKVSDLIWKKRKLCFAIWEFGEFAVYRKFASFGRFGVALSLPPSFPVSPLQSTY